MSTENAGDGTSASRRVLAALADGEVHSGQALAANAGVSRAAVWKAVEALRRAGHEIVAEPGRGYRAVAPYVPLSKARIRDALTGVNAPELQVLESIDSTNAELRRSPPEAGRVGIVIAERQTAGTGRLGRAWASPPGGVYISVSWPYRNLERGPTGLTLAVGVCVAERLRALGVGRAAVKWPNDVWVDGRKLAGILTELSGDPTGQCRVVVGIGVNWRSGDAEDGSGLAAPSVGVADIVSELDRNTLAAGVVNAVVEACATVPARTATLLAERWPGVDLLAGQAVVIHLSDRREEGTARGIDTDGALLVETPGGVSRFFSGDVRVRPA
ncbi:Bifunctional ligase/repressor BirA [wastewater metagenome]|uniref:Bifunctional ligase/repressor BirA n=4 Tax=root TaxID=1 RepID=A0A5B8RHQ8_9ZZZZ|nr:biotin--[acetyl-CoA-carboxylase] ligase [Arhodomonas aquaeolei]MCS4505822.1 biotin--[acetyl-CoA-carboxylase] ligase [Arhodomonas aquaeolei]QEA06257.1 bifunctional ligase/repressor BirA [uncultured organism]